MKAFLSAARIGLLLAVFAFNVYPQTCSGCLDTEFGSNGFVITSVNSNTANGWANAVAIQQDGKIVVAADSANYENTATSDVYVLRYHPDGVLDETFGTAGVTRIAFNTTADRERPYTLALQSDGKILVGGWVQTGYLGAVARLDQDGRLDPGFGSGGKLTFTYANKENADVGRIVLQANGQIILGGTSGGKVGLARLNADGSFDKSFNGSGKLSVSVSPQKNSQNGGLSDLTIQPDGKYLVSGLSGSGPRQPQSWMLMRVNPDGTLDSGFGTGGKVINNLGGTWSVARNVHVFSDGTILTSGDILNSPYSTYVYIRYLSNGQIDSTFGSGGKVTMAAGGSSRIEGMHVQADGRIVGSGWWRDVNTTNTDVVIMRLNADGSMDSSFGTNGFTFTDHLGLSNDSHAMAVQSDGKFVLAGIIHNSSSTPASIGVSRYLP